MCSFCVVVLFCFCFEGGGGVVVDYVLFVCLFFVSFLGLLYVCLFVVFGSCFVLFWVFLG